MAKSPSKLLFFKTSILYSISEKSQSYFDGVDLKDMDKSVADTAIDVCRAKRAAKYAAAKKPFFEAALYRKGLFRYCFTKNVEYFSKIVSDFFL